MKDDKKVKAKIIETTEKIGQGLLVSKRQDGRIHGRPMNIAHIDENASIFD